MTLVQLQIAVGRVGNHPDAVLAEINGTRSVASAAALGWGECFGRTHTRSRLSAVGHECAELIAV